MIQIRSGDLVAVRKDGVYFLIAVMTKQILFGGHWVFVFHGPRSSPPVVAERAIGEGFNAAVDFIIPKREDRILRVRRDNDFSHLAGPELLQQPPVKGQVNYRIWRWMDRRREKAEFVRFTPSPTDDEQRAPHYSCIPADFACELAARGWREHDMSNDAMKDALREHFVPQLRARGFKGSLPHFRRAASTGIDLLTIQFDRWGGGFVIEIGRCGPTGVILGWGKAVPPNKVTTHDLHPNLSHRLGAPTMGEDGKWLRYDNGTPPAIVAQEAAAMLFEADGWWRAR